MQSYAFFDHLNTKTWNHLVDCVKENPSSDIGFIHSPDGKKHEIKSKHEQHALQEALGKIWVKQKTKECPFDTQKIEACKKEFNWLFCQAKRRVLGSKNCPILTVKEAMRVMENLEEYETIHGKSLTPYEFLKNDPNICPDLVVSNILCYCLADPEITTGGLVSNMPLGKIFSGGTKELSETAIKTFNELFKKLATQLQEDESINPVLATTVIENMLALTPYFSPAEGQKSTIPVLINGKWNPVDYTVERIRISAEDYPMDPYHAYGFMPEKKEPQAPPQLVFMGTTFLPGTGTTFTLLSDLHPLKSVGMWGFEQGKEAIEKFLRKATVLTGRKAYVTGQSLGGCMTLHTATHFHRYVSQAHAFSPAALLKHDLDIWDEIKETEADDDLPTVNVYRQQHDRVPMFGNSWGNGWSINYVKGFAMNDSVEGHIRIGAAAKEATLSRVKEKVRPSLRRNLLRALHVIAGGALFALGIAFVTLVKVGKQLKRSVKKMASDAYSSISRVCSNAMSCLTRLFSSTHKNPSRTTQQTSVNQPKESASAWHLHAKPLLC